MIIKRWGQHIWILMCLVRRFFLYLLTNATVLLSTFFANTPDYDPSHRHSHHEQNTFITFSVCLCIGFYMYVRIVCNILLLSIWYWAKNNEIPFTSNKNYSHIVGLHSNLCVGWDEDRNMKRSHTWHQFQRKWTFNSKFIVSPIPAPCSVSFSLSRSRSPSLCCVVNEC